MQFIVKNLSPTIGLGASDLPWDLLKLSASWYKLCRRYCRYVSTVGYVSAMVVTLAFMAYLFSMTGIVESTFPLIFNAASSTAICATLFFSKATYTAGPFFFFRGDYRRAMLGPLGLLAAIIIGVIWFSYVVFYKEYSDAVELLISFSISTSFPFLLGLALSNTLFDISKRVSAKANLVIVSNYKKVLAEALEVPESDFEFNADGSLRFKHFLITVAR